MNIKTMKGNIKRIFRNIRWILLNDIELMSDDVNRCLSDQVDLSLQFEDLPDHVDVLEIESMIEEHEFDFTDEIAEAVGSAMDDYDPTDTLETVVENRDFTDEIAEAVSEYDFDEVVQEAVSVYDFDEVVQEAVSVYDFDEAIFDAIGQHDFRDVAAAVGKVIQAEVAKQIVSKLSVEAVIAFDDEALIDEVDAHPFVDPAVDALIGSTE